MKWNASFAGMSIVLLAPLPLCAQIDPVALLNRARANILENVHRLPKYTCTQTVHRTRFESSSTLPVAACEQLEKRLPPQSQAWADRYKLDVTISEDGEIFSWPGNRLFRYESLEETIGADGMTGTGDFGPFLLSIFSGDSARYEYLGIEQQQSRKWAAYRYHVPLAASQYQIKVGSSLETVAYEGKFWIDPERAELSRMTIETRPPPGSDTCLIDNQINYQRSEINGMSFVLPALTTIELLDLEGNRYTNRVEYGSCRQFQAESVFRTDLDGLAVDGPVAKEPLVIPAGVELRIALRSILDSHSAFAGDAIEGVLMTPIQMRHLGPVVVPGGAIVHGVVVRFEEQFRPRHSFILGLKFDSVEVNGKETTLALAPIFRSKAEQALAGPIEKRQGIGLFIFPKDPLVLDRNFISDWKTK